MKKKTVVKVALDVLMLAVIALMYRKQALGLAFHEIGGLLLIGIFFVHKGLNFKWIRRVTVKLRTADNRTRLMWIVDALMLVAFLIVGVSGIMISKVAFPGLAVQGGPWKSLHYGCAALSLILVGVHLGLHYRYLKGIFSRWIRLPRAVAAVLVLFLMAYGAYGVAATSFTRWLAMPFSADAQRGEGSRGGNFPGAQPADASQSSESTQSVDATLPVDASQSVDATLPIDAFQSSESTVPIDASQPSESTQSVDATLPEGESDGSGRDRAPGDGQSFGRGGHEEPSGSALGALSTLAQFTSIAFLFAALTALIDRALRKKSRLAGA